MTPNTIIYVGKNYKIFKDGGSKSFDVLNPEECGITIVVQDFAIRSKAKGKYYDGFPSYGDAKEILESQLRFVDKYKYIESKKQGTLERDFGEKQEKISLSEWRDPEKNPPTKTGKILVWIDGVGPSLVNVEERWMCFWNGHDETEPTDPSEWDKWCEIYSPKQ